MKALSSVALAVGLLALAPTAHAAGDAEGFGDKHQLIISADRLLPVIGYTHASQTTSQNGIDITSSNSGVGIGILWSQSLALSNGTIPDVQTIPRVAFDYTIIDHLTLGGALALGFGLDSKNSNESVTNSVKTTAKTDGPSAWAIGFAPRVGYVLPFSEHWAFWPRAGVGIYHVSSHQDAVTNNGNNNNNETTVSDTLLSLDLDPQLVLTPMQHLFLTLGPTVNIPLTGTRSVDTTNGSQSVSVSNDISLFRIGLNVSIGGWFDL
jgi:hypothetical protein